MIPLTLASGWVAGSAPPGYYLHGGRAYIAGLIENATTGEGIGSLICTLPAAARPSGVVHVDIPILPESTTDACNKELNLPEVWPSTVHPDGKWELDPLPGGFPEGLVKVPNPAVWFYRTGVPPEEVHPQYTQRFSISLVVANAQWPVGSIVDVYTPKSLAEYIYAEEGFEDINSEYKFHGSRVHLLGKIAVLKDRAYTVLNPLPPTTGAGLPGFPSFGEDFSTCRVSGRSLALGVQAATSFSDLYIPSDQYIQPIHDSPPLIFEGEKAGPDLVSRRQLAEYSATASYEASAPPIACEICNYAEHEGKGNCENCHEVVCNSNQLDFGASPPHFSLGFSAVTSTANPPPDWCLLELEAVVGGSGLEVLESAAIWDGCATSFHVDGHGVPVTCAAGCNSTVPPWDVKFRAYVPPFGGAETALPGVYDDHAGEVAPVLLEGASEEPGITGMVISGLLMPPASLYKGDPRVAGFSVDPRLLWTRAQVEAAPPLSFYMTYAHLTILSAKASVAMTPFWERRQVGVKAGEVLDFDQPGYLGGWEGAGLELGPETQAMIPRLG